MTTLHAIAPLLDKLFAEADASSATIRNHLGAMPEAERAATMQRLQTDWRSFYGETAKELHLAVSRATGTLLYMLARHARATSIVEFGTSFGLSTIHLAAALKDNGGGRLVTTEYAPSKAERARTNLALAGLAELVDIRVGDAVETLAKDLPASIDLVLLDGAKPLYPAILEIVGPRLRPGAILVADNAEDAPAYLERVRGAGWLSVPFGDDVEVSMRAAP